MKKTGIINANWGVQYSSEASTIIGWFDFDKEDAKLSRNSACDNNEIINIKRVIWFIPEFDNPFWGGIHTILRFASYFKEHKNVENCFVILGNAKKDAIRELITKAYPQLQHEEICILHSEQELSKVKNADASICTLWTTAYHSLKFNNVRRKFYFIQDYEPLFYPAGSISALVEETYRFGFYGIANTSSLRDIYQQYYGGKATYFIPAVNTSLFKNSLPKEQQKPFTVFFYARPGHPRNGFELGIAALRKLKSEMGDTVRIVTAGSNWEPENYGLTGIIENLGLLNYTDTAELYRKCDLGLVMMFTRHPSYLPFELMACGCLVVTNFNPATTWFLHDKENCLLSPASVSSLCATMKEGLTDLDQRMGITIQASNEIAQKYSDWDREIEKVYSYMCNPAETKI